MNGRSGRRNASSEVSPEVAVARKFLRRPSSRKEGADVCLDLSCLRLCREDWRLIFAEAALARGLSSLDLTGAVVPADAIPHLLSLLSENPSVVEVLPPQEEGSGYSNAQRIAEGTAANADRKRDACRRDAEVRASRSTAAVVLRQGREREAALCHEFTARTAIQEQERDEFQELWSSCTQLLRAHHEREASRAQRASLASALQQIVRDATSNRWKRMSGEFAAALVPLVEAQERTNRSCFSTEEERTRRTLQRRGFHSFDRARALELAREKLNAAALTTVAAQESHVRSSVVDREGALRCAHFDALANLLASRGNVDAVTADSARERERIEHARDREWKQQSGLRSDRQTKDADRRRKLLRSDLDRVGVLESADRMRLAGLEGKIRASLAAVHAAGIDLAAALASTRAARQRVLFALNAPLQFVSPVQHGWPRVSAAASEDVPLGSSVPVPVLLPAGQQPLCVAIDLAADLHGGHESGVARLPSSPLDHTDDRAIAALRDSVTTFQQEAHAAATAAATFADTVGAQAPIFNDCSERSACQGTVADRLALRCLGGGTKDGAFATAELGCASRLVAELSSEEAARRWARGRREAVAAEIEVSFDPVAAPVEVFVDPGHARHHVAVDIARTSPDKSICVVSLEPRLPRVRKLTLTDVRSVLASLRVSASFGADFSKPSVHVAVSARLIFKSARLGIGVAGIVRELVPTMNPAEMAFQADFIMMPTAPASVTSREVTWSVGMPAARLLASLDCVSFPRVGKQPQTGAGRLVQLSVSYPAQETPYGLAESLAAGLTVEVSFKQRGVNAAIVCVDPSGDPDEPLVAVRQRSGREEVLLDGAVVVCRVEPVVASAVSPPSPLYRRASALRLPDGFRCSGLRFVFDSPTPAVRVDHVCRLLRTVAVVGLPGRPPPVGRHELSVALRVAETDTLFDLAVSVAVPEVTSTLRLPQCLSVVPASSGEVTDTQIASFSVPGVTFAADAKFVDADEVEDTMRLTDALSDAAITVEIVRGCTLGDRLSLLSASSRLTSSRFQFKPQQQTALAVSPPGSPTATMNRKRSTKWSVVAAKVVKARACEEDLKLDATASATMLDVALAPADDGGDAVVVGSCEHTMGLFARTAHSRTDLSQAAQVVARISAQSQLLGSTAKGVAGGKPQSPAAKKPRRTGLSNEIPDVVFPDHSKRTPNQPSKVRLELGRPAGGPSAITMRDALDVLRTASFASTCLAPQPGIREIRTILNVTHEAGAKQSFEQTTVLVVRPPVLQIPRHLHTMKFVNGCGWKMLNAPRVLPAGRDFARTKRQDTAMMQLLDAIGKDTRMAEPAVKDAYDALPRVASCTWTLAAGHGPGDHFWPGFEDDEDADKAPAALPSVASSSSMWGSPATSPTHNNALESSTSSPRAANILGSVAGAFAVEPTSGATPVLVDRDPNSAAQGSDRQLFSMATIKNVAADSVVGRIEYTAPSDDPDAGDALPPTLKIVFSRPLLLDSTTMSTVLARMQLRCGVIPEGSLAPKSVVMAVDFADGQRTYGCYTVFVSSYDEPSEIVVPSPHITHRHALQPVPPAAVGRFPVATAAAVASRPPVRCTALAPLGLGCIHDTDTEFFDGGFLSANISANGARGDRIRVMSAEEQMEQYEALDLAGLDLGASTSVRRLGSSANVAAPPNIGPPAQPTDTAPRYLLTTEESTSALLCRGVRIGTLVPLPDQAGVGCVGLRINFAAKDDASAQKSIVPIALASYVLNCLAFECAVEHAKSGVRAVRLAVADSCDATATEGATEVDVDVVQPFVYTPKAAAGIAHNFGSIPVSIASRVQTFLAKTETWNTGGIVVALGEDDMAGAAVKGSLLAFNPTLHPQVPFKVASDGALTDSQGVFIGRLHVSASLIHLQLTSHSRLGHRQLEGFMRCVTFDNRDAEAAAQKQSRQVLVIAADGNAANMANVAVVTINLRGGSSRR